MHYEHYILNVTKLQALIFDLKYLFMVQDHKGPGAYGYESYLQTKIPQKL